MNILQAHEMQEGDGVRVRRLFPFHRQHLVADPFVLWDDFNIDNDAGFPTHAHRGFEAITYLFDGSMNHADNLGNNSTVAACGAQRFTAGTGIQHSEMPGNAGPTTGIQLWINLPRSLKAIDPDYQQVDAADIPEHTDNGVTVREIVGEHSPLELKTRVRYAEIRMDSGSGYSLDVDQELQGILYLQAGAALVNDIELKVGNALQLEAGDRVNIKANSEARLMLALGKPHHEPVLFNGGFVD